MSHRSVVQLIKDAATSLGDNIQFGYGQRTDFNSKQKDVLFDQPWVWLIPLTANPVYTTNGGTENYQKQWNCFMLFLQQDQSDSIETQYKPILDNMDELVDKFVNRLNDWSMKSTDTVGAVTIRNFNQGALIKNDADIFTGWFLSFQLITSDDFEYCTPDNVELYAN